MTLNSDNGILTVGGDSTGAVKALDDVKKKAEEVATNTTKMGPSVTTLIDKYGGLAAKIGGAGLASKLMLDSFNQFQTASKMSADLFSQLGESGWLGVTAVNSITDAADNMIKVQTAASAWNKLVNSDLHMTQETVENLAKMSVDLGRKYGVAADQIMAEMSNAMAGGELSALRRYGIVLDEADANIAANKKAMEEYGRVASETEKKNAKAELVAKEIDKRYKDVIISASDINEIEAKYTNTKQKNMAIVAKTMEGTAKSVQSVMHAFKDAKDAMLGFANGLDNLDDKAIIAIRQNIEKEARKASGFLEEKLGKNLSDQSWTGIAEALKQEVNSITSTLDMYQKHKKLVTDEDVKQIKGALADRELLAQKAKDEVKALEEAIKLQRANLKEQGVAQTRLMQERRATIRDEINGLEKTLKQAKQREKIQSQIVEKQKELLTDYGLTDAMSTTDKMLQNMFNYGKESAEQLRVQQVLSDNFIKTIEKQGKITDKDKVAAKDRIDLLTSEWKTKESLLNNLELEVAKTEDIIAKKKKISIEDRARHERNKEIIKTLKSEQDEMTKLIGILQNIMQGIFKKSDKPPAQQGGLPAAWEAEFGRIMKVIKRGNEDAKAAIQAEFGSLDRSVILTKLKEKSDQVLQLEKQYQEKRQKQIDESNQKLLDEEKEYKEAVEKGKTQYQSMLQRTYDEEKNEIDKILNKKKEAIEKEKKTDNEEDLSYNERRSKTLSHYGKLQHAAWEHYKAMREIYLKIAQDENATEEQKKKARDDEHAALLARNKIVEEGESKLVEIQKAKERERKQVRDAAKQEIISYGEDLLRSTSTSMYDAMTMSNEALKESTLSRGEMLRRSLKETLATISKEAFVKSLMETAYGIAAVATGNPKASAHFAAAAAFAGVAGVALGASKGISAPSDAEVSRRKEKMNNETKSNSSASVGGTSSGTGTKIINVYFPNGVILGDRDSIVKTLNEAENEASRRGRL